MSGQRASTGRPMPRPFLKWAGGKRALMPHIRQRIPAGPIETFVEPFLGGGAAFLDLARRGRIKRAILGDRNPELVHTWRMVQEEPDGLIRAVEQWPVDEAGFYHVRDELDPAQLGEVDRAARVLWLSRTGFNGLYRKNRSGRLNTPWGKRTRVNFDPDNIRAVSAALRGVTLVDGDFEALVDAADSDAVVFCDPPYWPVSRTASFNAYDGYPFGPPEQARLVASLARLAERGGFGLLCNAWVPETVELAQGAGLLVEQVRVARRINSSGKKRGPVPELMATTHPWDVGDREVA